MAEVASVTFEQAHRRRVVQVHVLAVRKHELDVAQRIAGTGALADARAAGEDVVQHRWRECFDDLPASGHELEALAIEVTGVTAQAAARLRHEQWTAVRSSTG